MTDRAKQVPTVDQSTRQPLSMAALLAELEAPDDDVADVSALAPPSVAASLPRRPRTRPIADLTGLAKLWESFGEGNSGKTMFSRYLVDRLAQHGKIEGTAIAAPAPGNRNLTKFVDMVMQPPSTDPRATAEFTQKAMAAMAKGRRSDVFDFSARFVQFGTVSSRSKPNCLSDQFWKRVMKGKLPDFAGAA